MLTNEQFNAKLARNKHLSHIKPLEFYKGATEEMWFYCDIHKKEFQKEPHDLYKSLGCKQCGTDAVKRSQRKSTEKYKIELQAVNPEIELTDEYISAHTSVIHKCKKCNYGWPVKPNNLLQNKSGCPNCVDRVVNKKNCLWATRRDIARLLLNPKDGYKYKSRSNEKVDWKCEKCGSVVRNKCINDIITYGFSCPKCSDGVSYPNKVVLHLLAQIGVDFEREKTFNWSNNKRYDFYIPLKNCIVEVHGGGHYIENIECYGKTLAETQVNDKYKKQMAKENNIENYIIINAKISEIDYIKESVLNRSGLPDLLRFPKHVDWNAIHKGALGSNVEVACKLYNEEYYMYEIAEMLMVTTRAIRDYLKKGNELNLCVYDPKKCNVRRENIKKRRNKELL